jgi:hypothetical protein
MVLSPPRELEQQLVCFWKLYDVVEGLLCYSYTRNNAPANKQKQFSSDTGKARRRITARALGPFSNMPPRLNSRSEM